jgi:hypothetical protein
MTPPRPTDFTRRVFALVDKRDAAGFAALFAPDGRFAFGNAELLVEYHRLDGKSVPVPAVTIFTRDGAGLISHYRIFVDLAPLFAA